MVHSLVNMNEVEKDDPIGLSSLILKFLKQPFVKKERKYTVYLNNIYDIKPILCCFSA